MADYCAACGGGLAPNEVMCLQCQAPAAGYSKVELVPLTNNPLKVPEVCCCCLNPGDRVKEEKVDVYVGGNKKVIMRLPMPWCANCSGRRRVFKVWTYFLITLCLVGGAGSGGYLDKAGKPGWLCWTVGLGVAAFFFFAAVLSEGLPVFKRRGHTSGCDAFAGAIKQTGAPVGSGYTLSFRNKSFAARWRDLNPV